MEKGALGGVKDLATAQEVATFAKFSQVRAEDEAKVLGQRAAAAVLDNLMASKIPSPSHSFVEKKFMSQRLRVPRPTWLPCARLAILAVCCIESSSLKVHSRPAL